MNGLNEVFLGWNIGGGEVRVGRKGWEWMCGEWEGRGRGRERRGRGEEVRGIGRLQRGGGRWRIWGLWYLLGDGEGV